ncbi:MAG: zinc ribbon domain-containing protein [Thermoanaerobaculia bacterium]
MECPKCGTSQSDGNQECSVCGVVFERLRLAQERALLQRRTASSVPVPVQQSGIPTWLVVTAFVIVIAVGTTWTMKRRAERAAMPVKPNETAEKIKAAMTIVAAARGKTLPSAPTGPGVPRPQMAEVASSISMKTGPVTWPEGLTERHVRDTLERCPGLSAESNLPIPKVFPREMKPMVLSKFKWLDGAINAGYITLDELDDYLAIRITPTGRARMRLNDMGNMYELAMGRQRISAIRGVEPIRGGARVQYTWHYEGGAGLDHLIGGPEQFTGEALFDQAGGAWTVENATIGSGEWKTSVCD